MSKTITVDSLLATLPSVLKRDPKMYALAKVLAKQLVKLHEESSAPSILANIDRLTSKQLDHLAYTRDASVWRDTWPDSLKRSMIRNIIKEKRTRGTAQAVKDALSALGSSAKMVPWFEQTPKGEPYTFAVYVTLPESEDTVDAEMQEDVLALIDYAKALRSHYTFTLQRALRGKLGINATIRPVVFSRIEGGQ